MKKNRLIFIILGIIVFALLVSIVTIFILKDDSNKDKYMYITCEEDYIDVDGELTCELKGNGIDYDVCGISSKILKSDDYELLEVNPDSSWEGDGEGGDIDLYTDIDKKNQFNIVTFKIKLLNNNVDEIKINISDNIYVDQNIEEHTIEDYEKILKIRR